MNKYNSLIISFLIFLFLFKQGLAQQYKIVTIAFYNLENLFDCEDDELTFDNEYTPYGKNNWTEKRLNIKLENLANTIAQIGISSAKTLPVLLGVSEVENKDVLERLIKQDEFRAVDYGIAHFNSPDRRGIDVALLYNRDLFKITNAKKHRLNLRSELNEIIYTRDQLCVSGYLEADLIYCIVNHWPSRRGGQKRSEPRRIEAAKLTKKIIDSINSIKKDANIIVMGDFNDNPTDKSFKKILSSRAKISSDIKGNYLYNPMESMYKKGMGSLGYRDQWSLFDQILLSKSLVDSINWMHWSTHIFNANYLKNKIGKYKGYPKRTFAGGKYEGGYSDHFPVYSFLIKQTSE